MNHRDTIVDLLTATTQNREDAERMLKIVEQQAYAEGYVEGYNTARWDYKLPTVPVTEIRVPRDN